MVYGLSSMGRYGATYPTITTVLAYDRVGKRRVPPNSQRISSKLLVSLLSLPPVKVYHPIEGRSAMGVSLAEAFTFITVEELKQIAKGLGIGKKLTRKQDLIRCIINNMDQQLDVILDCLTEEERLYVSELAHNGYCDPFQFIAKFKKKCPYPQEWIWNQPRSPFILLVTDQGINGPPCVPDELIEPLRSRLPKPMVIPIETFSEIPRSPLPKLNKSKLKMADQRFIHIYEGERIVFQELQRVLSLVLVGKMKVSDKNKTPTRAAVRTVSEVLILPDFDLESPKETPNPSLTIGDAVRAYAWPVILQQFGWGRAQRGKLMLTPMGKKFIESPKAETFRDGFKQLLKNDEFDELHRISNIRGQGGKARRFMSEPSFRKIIIGQALAQWPVNQWMAIDEAFRSVFATTSGYDVIHDGYYFNFSDHQYGSLSGCETAINMQYFRVFLFEMLATLGVIDIAYVYPHWLWPDFADCWGIDELDYCGRYDGLLFVRLTPLGAYCLGATKQYEAPVVETHPSFKVLANHEIVFVGDLASCNAELYFLEKIASRQGEFSWRLDQKPILDYLESGGAIRDVLDFLKRGAQENVPENVEIFLNDIGKKTAAFVEAEAAILIEVIDLVTAKLIAHHPQTKKYCYLAGEQKLAIPQKNLRAFRRAVKKLGFILPGIKT